MADNKKVNPAQIMQMARMMRGKNIHMNKEEENALNRLAQTGLSEEQQAQFNNVIKDKAKVEQLLSSPQAQELMKRFAGKQ